MPAKGGQYARDTQVSVARSREEIERVLQRYGATGFAYGYQAGNAAVMFEIADRRVRFLLPLPTLEEYQKRPQTRTKERAQVSLDKEYRRRWRALALVIKSKLEAVGSGIVLFEDEFLAHIVTRDGRTVGDWARPQLAKLTTDGLPPLLPGV